MLSNILYTENVLTNNFRLHQVCLLPLKMGYSTLVNSATTVFVKIELLLPHGSQT